MLLTITTTHVPATDLGYLLAKNPAKLQTFSLSYGQAHVFYPVATPERCTAALLLEIDPIGLVRGRPRGDVGTLDQYVRDRPYVASSFLSVAIAQVFGSALGGRSRERPELAQSAIPLEVALSSLPCRGAEGLLRKLFEPLGYELAVSRLTLDSEFPEWGESPYFDVRLRARVRLQDLLSHLYVLIPVLDDDKHYWVGDDEVEKLLAKGEGWLANHPEKDQIAHRYLKHVSHLARRALDRLMGEEGPPPSEQDEQDEQNSLGEEAVEQKLSLHEARLEAVASSLREAGASTVIDLGCGEGKLLARLLRDKAFTRVAGVDVSPRVLELAAARLQTNQMAPKQRERLQLFQGALTYRDKRFAGYDAAALVEVIEHVQPSRLAALERIVFEFARPGTVVVTTPNAEYNVKFENLPAGRFRHADHRFEWTRAQFLDWTTKVGARFGYTSRVLPVGEPDAALGAPTQMAVFSLAVPPPRDKPSGVRELAPRQVVAS
ncbi:MAG: 3' terminal RNA ribose 2'-O-methyltransferase Hen1 [Deltaproteobacteria bacterium]